jgi:hypothetical protein
VNTRNPPSGILADALSYHAGGLCVIPIRPGTKKPACHWTVYQKRRPDQATLRRWFAKGGNQLGIIMGAVSGGVVCRDFDRLDAYKLWAAAHPELSRSLPTVETPRGRHVYFRAAPEHLRFVDLGDGEYRGDSGHLSLAPPSKHPSGATYRWVIPMPATVAEVPLIDPDASGLSRSWAPARDPDPAGGPDQASDPDPVPDATEKTQGAEKTDDNLPRATEKTESTESTEDNRRRLRKTDEDGSNKGCWVLTLPPEVRARIHAAISATLPAGPGRRNKAVFELCRALQAIPELTAADPVELIPVVVTWHKQALPVISTKPFDETLIDFLNGWPKVKYPRGTEPIREAFEVAKKSIPPEAAKFHQPGLRLLLSLCRQLQLRAGPGKFFFLSCRTAGYLLGVDHRDAARWLFLLEKLGLIVPGEIGSLKTRRATRYQYIGQSTGGPTP